MPVFVQAEDGIRLFHVTGVQTCALPIFGIGIGVAVGAWAAGWLIENQGARSGLYFAAGAAALTALIAVSVLPWLKRGTDREPHTSIEEEPLAPPVERPIACAPCRPARGGA